MVIIFFAFFVLGRVLVSGMFDGSEFDCKSSYFWMHVPKTSSTFCLTLQHICCTEEYESIVEGLTYDSILENQILQPNEKHFQIDLRYGCAFVAHRVRGSSLTKCRSLRGNYHRPIPKTFDTQHFAAITFLREPKSRLISAFLDASHHEGMDSKDFLILKEKMYPTAESEDTDSVERLVHAARLYAQEPAFLGCQTKMVLGYQCGDTKFILPRVINQTIISEAVDRLRQFYFVGIFEQYSLSVHLFYRMIAKKNGNDTTLVPSILEILPTRKGDHTKASIVDKYLANYTDPYDSILYKEGLKLFNDRIDKFHIDFNAFPPPSSSL